MLSERVGNGFNKESHKAELKHNVAFANTVLASFCKYHVNWSLTNKKKSLIFISWIVKKSGHVRKRSSDSKSGNQCTNKLTGMLTTLLGKGTEGTGLWQLITGNTAFLHSPTQVALRQGSPFRRVFMVVTEKCWSHLSDNVMDQTMADTEFDRCNCSHFSRLQNKSNSRQNQSICRGC